MAEITIHLQFNLNTGKKDVFVDFVSEEDALPIEHEQQHRRIVEQLLGKGILLADELGEIQIHRVSPAQSPCAASSTQTEAANKQAAGQS